MEGERKIYYVDGAAFISDDEEFVKHYKDYDYDGLFINNTDPEKIEQKPHEELDDLGLSVRATFCIKQLGIKTIDEFKKTEPDFYDRSKNPKVRNVNDRVFQEITTKLSELKNKEN